MCAHMLHDAFGRPAEAARAAGHSRVRGPHVVHTPQPRAHQPRTDPGNKSHGRRTPRLRGRVRAAQPWRAARRRRQRRHFAPGVDRAARAPRPDRRRHRFAHDTQRCSGLHRLRRGQHRLANSLVTGAVRITVPRSLRIEITGRLPAGVTAKDVVLHLLATPRIKAGAGVGKVFEFTGDAVALMSTDERATLTNMTAELGGFTGIVAPDAETVRFLRERRGIEITLEPWMCSDRGAEYAETIHIDCSTLGPIVASAGRSGQRRSAGLTEGAPADRHRLRRVLHRRQARGLRPLPRGAGVGAGARPARQARRRPVPAVRHDGGPRLLHCNRVICTPSRRSARKFFSPLAAPAPIPGPARPPTASR